MAIGTSISLSEMFVRHVKALRDFLRELKQEFLLQDHELKGEEQKINFLLERKANIFKKLDRHFDLLWGDLDGLSKDDFDRHKKFLEAELLPYLAGGIETNTYIRQKPLGYAGDYVTMNFIYDDHDGRFLGNTLYTKLINHYTCNIDVALSNIARKDYLKKKILDFATGKDHVQILSVGCGPAREIAELLKEGKLRGPVTIHLLDLEKNAIAFVQEALGKIDFDRSRIKIIFHILDLITIVKSKKIKTLFHNVDLIYISGVFDYLSNRLAGRVLKGLFDVTRKELIVFNMSLENARHRVYYEVLGEWVMYHRTKEELLKWNNYFVDRNCTQEELSQCRGYWVLRMRKP